MCIVCLRLLKDCVLFPAMNHPSVHWNRLEENFIQQAIMLSFSYRVDAPFRQGKVNGFGKVQRRCQWSSKIFFTVRLKSRPENYTETIKRLGGKNRQWFFARKYWYVRNVDVLAYRLAIHRHGLHRRVLQHRVQRVLRLAPRLRRPPSAY